MNYPNDLSQAGFDRAHDRLSDRPRKPRLDGMTLGKYLQLVDQRKREAAEAFDRLKKSLEGQ